MSPWKNPKFGVEVSLADGNARLFDDFDAAYRHYTIHYCIASEVKASNVYVSLCCQSES